MAIFKIDNFRDNVHRRILEVGNILCKIPVTDGDILLPLFGDFLENKNFECVHIGEGKYFFGIYFLCKK